MLRGVVHDPTARRMGGVAGHAGLFSTAADLAIFCRMLLDGGDYRGTRILSPLTVAKMTTPASAPGDRNVRGLGWDIDSAYSSNRGELLPVGSFGHTGFTGTSLWIDPATEHVRGLSVEPRASGRQGGRDSAPRARGDRRGRRRSTEVPPDVRRHRRDDRPRLRTVRHAAGAGAARPVLTGIDVLRANGFASLQGKRVGLVTNHTGRARDGATTIDLLHGAKDVTLVRLFSPEHGIRGILDADRAVGDRREDGAADLSRSTAIRGGRPPRCSSGLDAIVIDLQDIGARFYTYMTTMAYVLEEAAKRKIPVVVLDRPNPIDGFQIEGPTLDKAALRFTAYFPMPIRHGMTIGELARLFNGENKIGADLDGRADEELAPRRVVRRDRPAVDQPVAEHAQPDPGDALSRASARSKASNVSVGRGTDTPFEQVGAPWIDGVALSDALNARATSRHPVLPGAVHADVEQVCQRGMRRRVHDRDRRARAAAGARRRRDRGHAEQDAYGAKFELESADKAVWLEGGAGADSRRRRPARPRQHLGRRRSEVASFEGKVLDLPVACPRTNELTNPPQRVLEHLRQDPVLSCQGVQSVQIRSRNCSKIRRASPHAPPLLAMSSDSNRDAAVWDRLRSRR